MSLDFRYTTRFAAKGHVIQPTEDVRNEARASLDQLKSLLPDGYNPEEQPDLLYFVGNLAVGGVLNKNDDAVSIEDALAIYRRFEQKLCDIEHDRKTIVGYILKAGLSEMGTNRPITEDEARAANVPFNITTVTVLWRVANKELCAFIEELSTPGSPDKDALSLSFEVGFNDYDIVLAPKGVTNLAQARIIDSDSPHFDTFSRLLRVNKGKGVVKETGERVGRVLCGRIVPLGEGIVTVPAADVKGIAAITSRGDLDTDSAQANDGPHEYSCAMVNMPEDHARAFLDYSASIPDDHLYNGEEGSDSYGPQYGRETTPHATVLYGIKSPDAASIRSCVEGFGPITACLGAISSFESDDKPYDVLKAEVDSPDIHRLHHLIKTSTDCHLSFPTLIVHATVAYLKKGMAKHYVGDQRFMGKKVTFSHVVFSSHAGEKTLLPLNASTDSVYANTSMNRIKMSQGWVERFASFKAKDPLVNAVTVTLSDGRVLKDVHIFDGKELEFDKTVSIEGVVITDMTPGNPPQVDTSKIVHPHAGDVFPTVAPVHQAEDATRLAEVKVAQQSAYTDASVRFATTLSTLAAALAKLPDVTPAQSRVSLSTSHSPMNLDKLNQSVASLQKAIKPEDKEAVANVAFLAEEIAHISEQFVQAKKDAEAVAAQTVKDREDTVAARAEVAALKTSLAKMEEAQARAQAEALFQAHMVVIAETFDFDDETMAVLLEDIKACTSEESFAKFMDKQKKVSKEKTKEFKKKQQAKADDDMAAQKAKKAKDDKDADDGDDSAKAAQEAIASAKANGIDSDVQNNLDTTETLTARAQRVFGDNISFNGVNVSTIMKNASDASKS